MIAIIRPDEVKMDDNGNETLCFLLDNGRRFIECSLIFDPESEQWKLTANDSEIASI